MVVGVFVAVVVTVVVTVVVSAVDHAKVVLTCVFLAF